MKKLDQLEPSARARLAFSPLQYMFDFVSENPQSAEIYTDDALQSCALLLGHYLFIGGGAGDAFLSELAESVFPPERRAALGALIVFYDRAETADAFKRLFGRTYDNQRSVYRLRDGVAGEYGPRVTRVTDELLASDTANLDMIVEEVLGTGTYPDMRRFCANGIGYTYIDGGAVQAFCTSEYPSRSAVAIGIEVKEAYQRRGIAAEMTRALVADATSRGLAVYWECWKRNEPSARTAMKCGFDHVADYPVLFADFA